MEHEKRLVEEKGMGKMNESNSRKKSCTLLVLITLHLPFLEKNEITILFPLLPMFGSSTGYIICNQAIGNRQDIQKKNGMPSCTA